MNYETRGNSIIKKYRINTTQSSILTSIEKKYVQNVIGLLNPEDSLSIKIQSYLRDTGHELNKSDWDEIINLYKKQYGKSPSGLSTPINLNNREIPSSRPLSKNSRTPMPLAVNIENELNYTKTNDTNTEKYE